MDGGFLSVEIGFTFMAYLMEIVNYRQSLELYGYKHFLIHILVLEGMQMPL